MGLRKVKGSLIRTMRGERSQDEIVKASEGKFKKGHLSAWENERWFPNDQNTLALANALGCDIDDITVPVELESAA
jgi:hypothetical protein